MKLLCLLEVKQEAARTEDEKVLVEMFSNQTDSMTSYNAPFVVAADLGAKTHDSAFCEKFYNKCTLSEAKLSAVLHKARGCDLGQ